MSHYEFLKKKSHSCQLKRKWHTDDTDVTDLMNYAELKKFGMTYF